MQHHLGSSPLTVAQAKIWGTGAFQDYILTVSAEEKQQQQQQQQRRRVRLSPRCPPSDELASIATDPVTRGILLRHRCRLKFLDGDSRDQGRRCGDGDGGGGDGGGGGARQKSSSALSSFSVRHCRVRISGPDHAAIRRCCTLLAARFPAFANRTPAATASATAHNGGCGPVAAAATAVRDVRAEAGARGLRYPSHQQQQPLRWGELRRKWKPGHGCEGAESGGTGGCSSFLAPCQLELEGFTWDKDCRFYKPVADTAANLAAKSTATNTQQWHRQQRNNYWGIGDDNYSAFFTASQDSNLHDMLHCGNSLTDREEALSAKSSVTYASFTILLSGDSPKVDRSKAEKCRRNTDADTPRCNGTSDSKKCHRHKMTRDISIQTIPGLRHMWPCSSDDDHAEPSVMKSAESDTVTIFTLMSSKIACADAATMCSGYAKQETKLYENSLKVGRSKAEKCNRDADTPRCDRTSDSKRSHRRKATMDISIQTISGLHQNRSCSNYVSAAAAPAAMKPAEPDRLGKFTLTSGKSASEDAAQTMCLRPNKQESMLNEATVQPKVTTNANSAATNRKFGFRGKLVHKKITWFIRTGRTRPTLARI